MAIIAGVVILIAIMTFVRSMGEGGTESGNNLFIFLNAVIGVPVIIGGFAFQRKLDQRLTSAQSQDEATRMIRTHGIISLAIVEGSAIFAVISMFITGDMLNLAFVVPFFAFAWLFFPSDSRFNYWNSIWESYSME